MKPPKSGSGTKDKKAYYLSDALQFTVPYIKTLGRPSGNLPPPPRLQEEGLPADAETCMEDVGSETLSPFILLEPSTSLQSSTPSVDNSGSSAGSSLQREQSSQPISPRLTKRKRALQNEAEDKAFEQYLDRKLTSSTKGQNDSEDPKTEALKMFLLSLLPDLQEMNDQELRLFKLRTLEVVDEILSVKS